MKDQTYLAPAATQLICILRICWYEFAKKKEKEIQQSRESPCFQLSFSSAASYVSAMVPVKSPREYYVQQEVIVLFCETVER